jgi:hypothetical protein
LGAGESAARKFNPSFLSHNRSRRSCAFSPRTVATTGITTGREEGARTCVTMPMKFFLSKLPGQSREHQLWLPAKRAHTPKKRTIPRVLYSGPNGYWWMESSSFVGRTIGKSLSDVPHEPTASQRAPLRRGARPAGRNVGGIRPTACNHSLMKIQRLSMFY